MRRASTPVSRPVLRTAALALVAGLALAGCSDDQSDDDAAPAPDPVRPAPVGLAVADGVAEQDEPVRLGLLVSLSSVPGQGDDVLPGAAGAQVAAYRFRMAGVDVELQVANDRGTRGGVVEAVGELVDAGVSGIVAATAGSHLAPGLAAASEADVPVVAPYLRTTEPVPVGVWTTGPSAGAVGDAIDAALGEEELTAPFVLTGDGVDVPGVSGPSRAELRRGNLRAVLGNLERAVEQGTVDSLVLAASARTQGEVVAALQARLPELPVLLTPDALSPVFARTLVSSGGTPEGELLTVGADAGDITTLGRTEAAEAAASYFSALRLAASDPELQDAFGGAAFAEVAPDADVASHDAVVVLVRAIGAAGSADPAAVTEALSTLQVDGDDGLAGPALDLTRAEALSGDAVLTLRATTQDPGVRPAGATPQLFWFAVPREDG